VEVQALVVPTFFQFPKRSSNGFDINRLQILIAVLEKRGGVNLNNADVYVNVAGGLRINETAADMAVCAAIISSLLDKALSQQTVFVGEVGLSGEVRAVSNMSMRLSEAVRFGSDEICAPGAVNNTKIRCTKISNVKELINEKFT
jgi:DNA repair protein RadA/Sms